MSEAVRKRTTTGSDGRVVIAVPELPPGTEVDVIVTTRQSVPRINHDAFWNAIAAIAIDADADYSVSFERALHGDLSATP